MVDLTEQEAAALLTLQRGIPLTARPFAEVGASCGLPEAAVLNLTRRLLKTGDARRFGAVFDARRLGYRSALCAMTVPADRLAGIAAKIVAVRGVTHAYARGWPDALPRDLAGGPGNREWPNVWFTLAAPAPDFERELNALRDACRPFAIDELPAVRRFKIDVVFDLRTRDRDERVEPRPLPDGKLPAVPEFDARAKCLIQLLEGDLPVTADFFETLAEQAGWDGRALQDQLLDWQASGVMRRIGLLLQHRKIGFKANGMCCWDMPEADVTAAGRRVSAFPEVTHCYERPRLEIFPFRLYAMIHTPVWSDTQRLFERISEGAGLSGGQLLLSVSEFKKTSMQFFSP